MTSLSFVAPCCLSASPTAANRHTVTFSSSSFTTKSPTRHTALASNTSTTITIPPCLSPSHPPRPPAMSAQQQPSDADGGMPKFKFDPDNLDTNAFGRDPKKETDFWRESAKDVLASDEVRQAIERFQVENPDNLTEEQRAYKEFLRKMDEENSPASSEE